jgi:hypothetical protein
MEEIEQWKDIIEYELHYKISSFGNVKSLDRISKRKYNGDKFTHGINLKPIVTKKGYLRVDLQKDSYRKSHSIHRLVAMAFIKNPENKPQVNHKDGDKTNNHKNNLEWNTNKENQIHAYKTGLNKPKPGEENFFSKLKNSDIIYIRSKECKNKKLKELSEELKVSITTISDIKNRKIWTHL